jgi:hypothetical protein
MERTQEQAFGDHIRQSGVSSIVTAIRGYSYEVARTWTDPIDLLFIDANHEYESVRRDFEQWTPFVRVGGIVALHDVSATWPGPMRVRDEKLQPPLFGPFSQVDSLAWAVKTAKPMNLSGNLYDREFQKLNRAGSLRSANVVVPLIMEMVSPGSVVDVGCSVGAWLSSFAAAGVRDVLGLEGTPPDPELAEIEPSLIQVRDLSQPFQVDRKFDLALSLEVAEHLPEESAAGFIESLTRLAPVILFSAAVPGQTGVGHVNEQWPTYWASHFSRWGYQVFDCLRDRIWRDLRVEWWYRQNLLLFVREDVRANYPRLDCSSSAALDRKLPAVFRDREENLLLGDRFTQVSVTAGIASNGGPERLTACLRSIADSGFADEIVVCLDPWAPDGSREAALAFTKHVYEIESKGYFESAQPLLAAHCPGEYLLRLDDDESLAGTWERDSFDGLARRNSFTHFGLYRRWMIPGNLFIANPPWFPDVQWRLFRNDPRLIVWPGKIHDHMRFSGPGVVLTDRWIEHWNLVCSSRPEREMKCERCRSLRPEFHLSYCYLYEEEDIQTLPADEAGLRCAILATAGSMTKPEPPVYRSGELVDFRSGGNSLKYACQGWSGQEPWGTWTQAAEAELFFLLDEPFEAAAMLTACVRAFVLPPLHPSIRVEVECNGELIAVWTLDRMDDVEQSVTIPAAVIGNQRSLRLSFRIYHPASPYGCGYSADRRLLGMGVSTLSLG